MAYSHSKYYGTEFFIFRIMFRIQTLFSFILSTSDFNSFQVQVSVLGSPENIKPLAF